MFINLVKIELKSYFKDIVSCFFTFIVPVILILTLGFAFGTYKNEQGVVEINTIFATTLVFLIANNGLMGTTSIIGELKEKKTLKRYNSIGISPIYYISAFLCSQFIIVTLSIIISLVVTLIVFKPELSVTLLGLCYLIPLLIVGLTTFVLIGFIIVLFTKSVKSATMIGSCIFMIMIFSSGFIVPINELPVQVKEVVQFTPMYIYLDLIINIWNNTNVFENNINMDVIMVFIYLILSLIIVKKVEKNEN